MFIAVMLMMSVLVLMPVLGFFGSRAGVIFVSMMAVIVGRLIFV